MPPPRRIAPAFRLTLIALAALTPIAAAGPIAPPPGPVSSTYKTLGDVEPRRAVQSLAGDAQASHIITQPGSYYLTGDITRQAGKAGIRIESHNVTLDLCGFSLVGGDGPPTTNVGIRLGAACENLAVRNGTIRGWGYGVFGPNCRDAIFEDLALLNNVAGSLECSGADNCIFRNIRVAATSGEIGIQAASNCLIDGCVVEGSSTGITGTFNCTITRCSVRDCNTGLNIFSSSRVSGCVVRGCDIGIEIGHACHVEGCVISACAQTGILAGSTAVIVGNSITWSGVGVSTILFRAGGGRIDSNAIANCPVGLRIDSTNNTVVRNTIVASTTAPAQIIAGNAAGAMQTSPAAAGPWDNIVF